MIINGIDTGNLAIELPLALPDTVKGRVLQVDADGLCYIAGCYDDEPFSTAKYNFHSLLDSWVLMAGADTCVLHLTGANKGGRYDIATVKEYQANRKGKAKPKHLASLREYVRGLPECLFHEYQEADDGMAQGNYAAIKAGTPDLSCICSADKDLRMCSGWHLDQQTGELRYVDGYGEIELTEGKSKKIKGYGTSFFWAQCLMGDAADNIPGLPKLGANTQVRYSGFHTKAIEKLLDTCSCGDTKKENTAAEKLAALKPKACGAVATWHILHDCSTDQEAFYRVVQCYRDWYGEGIVKYKDYNGVEHDTTAGSMLVEQMMLLWMRRADNPHDIMDFVKGIRDGRTWTD